MNTDKIKEVLKSRKMSIHELEDGCGLPHGSVSTWRKHTPSVEAVAKAANYLECPIDDLIVKDG